MDLTVITVTYQSKEYIDACILSVVTATFRCSYEHIIVDNASTDGTVELIENGYSSFVRLIKNKSNTGFSAANNQAVREAKGRYILFLNPDMQIWEGTLDSMIEWMDSHPEAGISSCKLVHPADAQLSMGIGGKPHPTLRPIQFHKPFYLLPYFLNLKTFADAIQSFAYPSFNDDVESEVDQPRGAFLLMRKEIVQQLGFAFDPRYFILWEDNDLCREVKRLGYKIFYTPLMTCIDHVGRSFVKQSQPWKYLQIGKSFKSYVAKWHSPFHLLWLTIAIPIGFLLRIPEWGLKKSLKALFSKP